MTLRQNFLAKRTWRSNLQSSFLGARGGGTIFRNARSNASSLSSTPSFRAVSTNRSNCLLSVIFGSAFAFRRLFPYGLSVTSCSISEPLADDTFYRAFGALHIIYAKPDAIAIAEIKLRKIAVQMLLAAMLVDAFHAALEDRIVAFNGIGADNASPS